MYKIGLSTPCGHITEENLASFRAAGLSVMEISDGMEGYACFDYENARTLAEKYDIKLHSMHLPFMPFTEIDISALEGKTLDFVDEQAYLGTLAAHVDGGVPVITMDMGELNDAKLGELFYFFELACGVSAYMLGVNPFNQPGVEAYKKNMFALLGKPGYEDAKSALEARLG